MKLFGFNSKHRWYSEGLSSITRMIIYLVLMLTGCGTGRSKIETILTQKDNCWIYYNYPDEQLGKKNLEIAGCVAFYDDGTFDRFVLTNNERTKMVSLDRTTDENT